MYIFIILLFNYIEQNQAEFIRVSNKEKLGVGFATFSGFDSYS